MMTEVLSLTQNLEATSTSSQSPKEAMMDTDSSSSLSDSEDVSTDVIDTDIDDTMQTPLAIPSEASGRQGVAVEFRGELLQSF